MFKFKQTLGRILAVAAIAAMTLWAMQERAAAADEVWTARYFNNETLSGNPVHTESEGEINHDWGHGPPFADMSKDHFSVRWERTIQASGGTYRFTAFVDDGVRIYVDNVLVMDQWNPGSRRRLTADTYMAPGDHRIKVEYFEAIGSAIVQVSREKIAPDSPQPGAWQTEFYNNTTLSGAPAAVRTDFGINFDWGVGGPANGIAADFFSARWSRSLNLEPGKYRFTVTADDGVRLYVNNVPVIDRWQDQAATTYSADVDIFANPTALRLEYFENQGGAQIFLNWQRVGTTTTSPTAPTAPTNSAGLWWAEFYNNRSLAGSPVLSNFTNGVNFAWGYNSPVTGVVAADNFSARFTNTLNLSAGTYRFTAASDDGVRVWVNERLIIDQWNDHALRTFTGDITLVGGTVPVRVEYYDNTQVAEVHLSWSLLGSQVVNPTQPTGGVGTATVNVGALNVRSTPGVGNNLIVTVQRGATLTLVGQRAEVGNTTWVKVRLVNGTVGWVSARYIATTFPINTLPVGP